MKPWIKEYQPKSLKEVHGQDSAVKQLVDFVDNFKKQKKKISSDIFNLNQPASMPGFSQNGEGYVDCQRWDVGCRESGDSVICEGEGQARSLCFASLS